MRNAVLPKTCSRGVVKQTSGHSVLDVPRELTETLTSLFKMGSPIQLPPKHARKSPRRRNRGWVVVRYFLPLDLNPSLLPRKNGRFWHRFFVEFFFFLRAGALVHFGP